jgi:hypothetical protein
VAAFTILTLLFTFPLVLHLGTHVVGRNGDVEQYIWSFWWMRKAVLELQTNPFVTRWLYFPDGVSLRFFASNPAHAFFSMALQDALGLLTAYNLMSMLTFVASAMAMYWLALDITGSRAAAFVGGIVFGFAPTHFFHFNIGQANLFAVEFIPLYVLGMRRWLGQGGIRWLFGAVAALALSSLCNWEFAVYLLLFTALYVVATFVEQRQAWRVAARTLLPRTASLGVLYLAVMSPVVVPMIQELRQPEQYMVRSRYDTIVHSADLFAVFVPNPMHPLWREWGQRLNAKFQSEGVFVTTVSISYVAAGLAVLGAIRHWQRARFWLASGLIFWVLSLGPQLQIFGRTTAIPMPYELLFQSKIIQISRAPARYIIPALLCLAILAAIGVQSLQERRAGATTRMRRLRHGSVVGLIVGAGFVHAADAHAVVFRRRHVARRGRDPRSTEPVQSGNVLRDVARAAGPVWRAIPRQSRPAYGRFPPSRLWARRHHRGQHRQLVLRRLVLPGDACSDLPPSGSTRGRDRDHDAARAPRTGGARA